MSCSSQTLTGLLGDCVSSMGGVRKVWINHYDKVDGKPTVSTTTGTKGMITDIALTETGSVADEKFHVYNFKKNTANMTSTYTIDAANGTNYCQTDLNLVFTRQETVKRIEIAALAIDELAVIVLDANGKYWYLGYDEPVLATAAGGESGTQRADGNKYTITLQDTALAIPYEIKIKASAEDTGVDLSEITDSPSA